MSKLVAKAKKRAGRLAEIATLMDSKEQKKQERAISRFLMDLDERADERERYVQQILRANDDTIEDIVRSIVQQMEVMQGPVRLIHNGQRVNAIKGEQEMLERIRRKNFRYLAVRMLVSLAKWEVRIGNFKLPAKVCADCGKPVKGEGYE